MIHPLTVELGKIGDSTADKVTKLLELLQEGLIHRDDLPYLAANLTSLGAEQASAIVLRELAQQTAQATGTIPVIPEVSRQALDPARVAGAVRTVMAGEAEAIPVRLHRLVRGAVTEAAQTTRATSIRETETFEGWTRGIDSDSCQLCVWWWRDGRVWPKDHTMPTHPGCTCVQVPAISQKRLWVSDEAYEASNIRRVAQERANE